MGGGCAVKTYDTSLTRLITLKTKKIRFNDLGYIRISSDAVQVELFSAGQVVERFEIDGMICTRQGCMRKSSFNAEYLSRAYPDDLLKHVLLGDEIFGGSHRENRENGFQQRLNGDAYDILYRVDAGGQIYFKDRINRILIRIRPVKP